MKIRVYKEGLGDFLLRLTGHKSEDVDKLADFLTKEGIVFTYDNEEFLQGLVNPDFGKSSRVSLFPDNIFDGGDWTIINIESRTELMNLLCAGVEEGAVGLGLPSGAEEMYPIRGLSEVPYRDVNAVVAKFPKLSGFTGSPEATEYVLDHLSYGNEYVASSDPVNIIEFIIGRDDNRSKFYISFDEDYYQVSVLAPSELAETFDELVDDFEKERN